VSFQWPWALLVGPFLAALAYLAYRWRRRRPPTNGLPFPDLDLMAEAATPPRLRRRLGPLLAAVAALLLVVALARPETTRDVPRERATIMLAIDVSGSMAADDVSPYRLRAAQDAALRFADKVPRTYQVGLVSFSGGASVLVAPSTDRDALRRGIESLVPGGATAIGEAISTSLDAITETQGGVAQSDAARILLLSDGSNSAGISVSEGVRLAREAKVPVFTVALGTAAGTLPNGTPEGEPVPPDVDALAAVAEDTGGKSYESRDAASVGEVYAELGSFIGTEKARGEATARWAGIGFGLLLLAGAAWWRFGSRLT
jgi:Ca-activated chloride channel homolog